MQKAGEKPKCFGNTSTRKGYISVDHLEELQRRTLKPNATFINVGLSEYSGKMERTGRIPILIPGFWHFQILLLPKQQQRNKDQDKKDNKKPELKIAENPLEPSVNNSFKQAREMIPIITKFGESVKGQSTELIRLMKRGMVVQKTVATNMYAEATSENFPEKVGENSKKIYTNFVKQVDRVEKKIQKWWEEDD